jgi:acetyltransferase-like isoleucine patch superfamily enzyme
LPIIIESDGDNVIDIPEQTIAKGSGRITLAGSGNRIVMDRSDFPIGVSIQLLDGASLTIAANLNARNLFIHARQGAAMTIGEAVGFNGQVRLMMHEAGSMSVGRGCLFGDFTDVTNSDMHSIVDIASGERVNPARDVAIGERVWVGQRCMLLKGALIGDGSVIGAGSIVSSAVPPGCLAAGNPVRILKTGVTWDFKLL